MPKNFVIGVIFKDKERPSEQAHIVSDDLFIAMLHADAIFRTIVLTRDINLNDVDGVIVTEMDPRDFPVNDNSGGMMQ